MQKQMGFELHCQAGLKEPPLDPGLRMDWDQVRPSSTSQKGAFPLFVICEQIPLGRMPGGAWLCAGGDLHLGGGCAQDAVAGSILLPASPQTAPAQVITLGRAAVF